MGSTIPIENYFSTAKPNFVGSTISIKITSMRVLIQKTNHVLIRTERRGAKNLRVALNQNLDYYFKQITNSMTMGQ